jgi:hypothetical protein
MADKGPIWDQMVNKYGLRHCPYTEAVSWPFGEAIVNREYDVMSDTTKARRFGFHEWADAEKMLLRLFADSHRQHSSGPPHGRTWGL